MSDGRWPANVILSPNMAEALDEQSGNKPASRRDIKRDFDTNRDVGGPPNAFKAGHQLGYSDEGGASRFFLTAGYEPWELEWIIANGLTPCGT